MCAPPPPHHTPWRGRLVPHQSPGSTPPPLRVLRAWSTSSGVVAFRNRTLPSASATFAPPGWKLPYAPSRAHHKTLRLAHGTGGGGGGGTPGAGDGGGNQKVGC